MKPKTYSIQNKIDLKRYSSKVKLKKKTNIKNAKYKLF